MVDEPDKRRRFRTRRSRLLLAGVSAFVVALVASGIVAARSGSSSHRNGEGRPAQGFHLPDLRDSNSTVALADFRGRPVVVNFWASWCVPCRREMPALERVFKKVDGSVAFIGVNHEDARDDALQFLGETGVTYPNGYDHNGRVARDYGLYGIPSTVFIDARGRTLDRHTGGLTVDSLTQRINDLFGMHYRT